jgi:pimeloyl-ACP methyl ester carboxylesterase
LALKYLVLLPGLDGTGELFSDFLAALPPTLAATTVVYPTQRFLSYHELFHLVATMVPKAEPFVLLAESFSTPLALGYAATNPPNLAGVVVCAGFVRNPFAGWSPVVKAVAQPWIFRMKPPRFVLEYFLIGKNAPPVLIQKLRRVLQSVSPEVLSRRVQAVSECDAGNDLARTTVPVMYLKAANDRLLAARCSADFLRIKPDTFCVEVTPAPHLLLQREPEKTAELVTAFVQKLRV